METILLIEIILWGACLLIVLHFFGGLIVASLVEKNILYFFAIVFILLLLGFVPAWGVKICLNKYLSKPKPVNLTETCIDGEMRIIYQDTTHFCQSSHEHSSTFTSYLSPTGEVSQKDICIHCLRPFLTHNTPEEDRFCNAIADGVDAYYNSLTVNYTKRMAPELFIELTALDHSVIITENRGITPKNDLFACFFVILLSKK